MINLDRNNVSTVKLNDTYALCTRHKNNAIIDLLKLIYVEMHDNKALTSIIFIDFCCVHQTEKTLKRKVNKK